MIETLKYYKLGYSPIPVNKDKTTHIEWSKFKKSQPDLALIKIWFSGGSGGIALIVNKHYGFVVLDVEPGEDIEKIKQKYEIPETVCSRSGGGGWHLFFKYPPELNLKNIPLGTFEEKMELRTNGLITVPPSIHQSGNRYKWINSMFNHKMAVLPPKLLGTAKEKQETEIEWEKLLQGVSRGIRNSTATQIVGKLLTHPPQDEWQTVVWPLFNTWCDKCSPPLPHKERVSVFKSVVSEELSKHKSPETKTQTKPFSVADILNMNFPEESFLVEKLIPYKSLCVLSGYPESGKSWLILELARSIASGNPFLGNFKTQQGKVLIVDEESGIEEFKRRMKLLKFDPKLSILFFSQEGFKVDNQEQLGYLLETVKKEQIKLVVFDPFVAIHSKRENEAGDMQMAMESLQEFNLIGATVLFAHHHRKELGWSKVNPSQSLRGSSVLFGRVDSHLAIEKKENSQTEIGLVVTQEKLRKGKKILPFQVKLVENNESVSLEYAGEFEEEKKKIEETKEMILKILKEEEQLLRKEIIERLKDIASQRTIESAFAQLKKDKAIKATGNKKEIVTPSGKMIKLGTYTVSGIESEELSI